MQEIADVSLLKFGNMTTPVTGTTGLANLADNNENTFGYVTGTRGYYGLSLGTPTAIGRVDCRSTLNGFDASGWASGPNTIELRAADTQPDGSNFETHGVLLGSITFTETANTRVTRTVVSTNAVTQFLFVWVVLKTTVYAEAADITFFKPSAPAAPTLKTGTWSLRATDYRIALERTQLWWKKNGVYCWSCFHELRFDIELPEPSYVKVFGSINLAHRGGVYTNVGWGIKATVRTANSFAAMPPIPSSSVDLAYWQSVENTGLIPGSKRASNILGIEDHYRNPSIEYGVWLPAGYHRIEHWGNSHRTGMPEDGAYVELNQNPVPDSADPYTMLFMEVYR